MTTPRTGAAPRATKRKTAKKTRATSTPGRETSKRAPPASTGTPKAREKAKASPRAARSKSASPEARARALALRPRGPLIRMTFDAGAACGQALEALDAVERHAPEVARVQGFDGAGLEELRAIAENAEEVQRAYLAERRSGSREAPELARRRTVAAGRRLYKILAGLLDSFVLAEALEAPEVDALRLTGAPARLADELKALLDLFLRRWSKVGGAYLEKTALEAAQRDLGALKHATAPVKKRRRLVGPSPLEPERRRRFTLLFERYAELQAAVAAVRVHQGDATELTPSLHVRRPWTRRKTPK